MSKIKGIIFDLDGTVYLGDALLPTAGETITTLRDSGKRTLFLSNNPTRTREEYAAKLTRLGLPTPPADVVNSGNEILITVTLEQQRSILINRNRLQDTQDCRLGDLCLLTVKCFEHAIVNRRTVAAHQP